MHFRNSANYCWSTSGLYLYRPIDWQNYLTHWLRSVLCANWPLCACPVSLSNSSAYRTWACRGGAWPPCPPAPLCIRHWTVPIKVTQVNKLPASRRVFWLVQSECCKDSDVKLFLPHLQSNVNQTHRIHWMKQFVFCKRTMVMSDRRQMSFYLSSTNRVQAVQQTPVKAGQHPFIILAVQ